MTVYVDDARMSHRGMIMCHMVGERAADLHAMADALGVSRRWFHRGHYNICQSMRRAAVRHGALEISKRDAARIRAAAEAAP